MAEVTDAIRHILDLASDETLVAHLDTRDHLSLNKMSRRALGRARRYYSARRYCNSSFATLAVQLWLFNFGSTGVFKWILGTFLRISIYVRLFYVFLVFLRALWSETRSPCCSGATCSAWSGCRLTSSALARGPGALWSATRLAVRLSAGERKAMG